MKWWFCLQWYCHCMKGFFMVCQININLLPQRPPMAESVNPWKPTLPLCVPIQCVFSSNTTCVPPHDVFGGRGLDLYWHSGNARPLKAWWWCWCRTATPASSFLCVAWKFTKFFCKHSSKSFLQFVVASGWPGGGEHQLEVAHSKTPWLGFGFSSGLYRVH